jgi:pimeloyl-ACP methyl ester carboxylesterase
MQQKFIYHNKKITYTDTGVGEIVLLLHGFGEDNTIWNYQTNFLQNKCRLIIPNLPGSYNSDLLPIENISIDDYAIAIHYLIEQILENEEQKFTLLGHSMGGYITLAFAKLFPQRLNGFGLIHSTAFADSSDKKKVRLRGIETLLQYGSYAFLKNTIPNLFSTNFKLNQWQEVEKIIGQGNKFSVTALQQYYTAMMNRDDATIVLINCAVPVLFIIGTEDIAAPLNDMLQQCHLPNQSHILILENVGHMGMLEATEKVNEAIEMFIGTLK